QSELQPASQRVTTNGGNHRYRRSLKCSKTRLPHVLLKRSLLLHSICTELFQIRPSGKSNLIAAKHDCARTEFNFSQHRCMNVLQCFFSNDITYFWSTYSNNRHNTATLNFNNRVICINFHEKPSSIIRSQPTVRSRYRCSISSLE